MQAAWLAAAGACAGNVITWLLTFARATGNLLQTSDHSIACIALIGSLTGQDGKHE